MRLMKEGCQEGYQQGVAAEARRMRQSRAVTEITGGKWISPGREKQKPKHPQPTKMKKKDPTAISRRL